MWKCKHCLNEFNLSTKSEKANHSRWCIKNPKRDSWDKSKGTISKYGQLKSFSVECSNCNNKFNVTEREKLFPQKDNYYCNRSCANAIGGKAKADKHTTYYRTICFNYHDKKCVVCGEEKIVSVHHNDHNHNNNDPMNLIPLCPTHHQYLHSRYSDEIQPIVDEYIESKYGAVS